MRIKVTVRDAAGRLIRSGLVNQAGELGVGVCGVFDPAAVAEIAARWEARGAGVEMVEDAVAPIHLPGSLSIAARELRREDKP